MKVQLSCNILHFLFLFSFFYNFFPFFQFYNVHSAPPNKKLQDGAVVTDSGENSDAVDKVETVSDIQLDQTMSTDDESTVSDVAENFLDLHAGSDVDFD